MEDSIFTKILNGELPSYKVYEDDKAYAFLNIHPLTPGHTLVIPKKQVEFIWDLEPEDYQAVMDMVQKVGKQLRDTLDTDYVGVEVIGVDVPHAHVHVVPFNSPSDLHRSVAPDHEPDHDELAAVLEKVRIKHA